MPVENLHISPSYPTTDWTAPTFYFFNIVLADTAGVNNLLLDTWSRLRTEQKGHLATTQNGPMLGDVCKAREKKILSSQWTIKSKGSAYLKGAINASLDAEKAALQKEV